MKDDFGDRMKEYEERETGRKFLPYVPVYARLDGRCFSKFTKGLKRPYDDRMSRAMIETTKYLVEETNARMGYTQSDEISLTWLREDYQSDIFFSGKIQKMCSVLSGLCSTKFLVNALTNGIDCRILPVFDCRVFQLPNKTEAANTFLWREKDATKNAVSMAASYYYSHNELLGKSSNEKQEMIFQKGINFNDYPAFFKRGTFIKRKNRSRRPTQEEIDFLTSKNQEIPKWICRTVVEELEMPPFSKVTNRERVIFYDEPPRIDNDNQRLNQTENV